MRKLYSLVLIAAGLLIGTNAWATVNKVSVELGDEFEDEWNELMLPGTTGKTMDSLKIQLEGDITLTKTHWIGTRTMNSDTLLYVEIDLNGHDLNISMPEDGTDKRGYAFVLTHGTLKITNSTPSEGKGKINHSNTEKETFFVAGSTKKDVDPSKDGVNYFSHLVIGKDVTVNRLGMTPQSSNGYKQAVIAIDDICYASFGGFKVNYKTNVYPQNTNPIKNDNQNKGIANGVRIDIYGTVNGQRYGIKANGYLGNVLYFKEEYGYTTALPDDGVSTPNTAITGYMIKEGDDQYAQFIHVHPEAKITALSEEYNSNGTPTAVYAGGYARWLIEGQISGGSGAIIKSGDVVFNDATVEGLGSYKPSSHTTNSNTGQGSAILVLSDNSWVGDINVTVKGNTVASASTGYAIEEAVKKTVNDAEETEVRNISIEGGTFVGGTVPVDPADPSKGTKQGSISISQTTTDANKQTTTTKITVTGATIEGGKVEVGTDGKLTDLIPANSGKDSIQIAVDPLTGRETVIVSVGAGDPVANTFVINEAVENQNVNLDTQDLVYKNQVFNSTTKSVLHINGLMMNNPYADVKLTIAKGHTLFVDHVILNTRSQIIVEPGAKLIISGAEGIVSTYKDNIILQADATGQATFILNPAVQTNAEPLAKVQLITESKQISANPWKYVFHHFALPIQESEKPSDDHTNTTPLYTGESEFESYLRSYIYAQEAWSYLSNWSDMKPFTSYQLANNTAEGGVTYTFEGHLYGNKDRECSFPVQGFGYFGNSHLAPINMAALMSDFNGDVQKTIWIYNYTKHQYEYFTPDKLTYFAAGKEIKAMEAFVLYGNVQNGVAPINYEKAVYNPAMGISNAAPARNIENSLTNGALISVKAENGMEDEVILMEQDSYSMNFDNGADASKLMNEDGINLYVATVNGDQSIVADNNIENTLLSFKAGEATNYTLQLGKVFGEDYAIRDNVTGAVFNCAEGETYTFTQTANTTVSGRFEVVGVAKIATGIENAEAVKSTKGIYTITGQYLGENFEVLPAGVYVVNGVKVVK
jgi:hypothetical protein